MYKSIHDAALAFNVWRTPLWHPLNERQTLVRSHENQQLLTVAEEEELARWITQLIILKTSIASFNSMKNGRRIASSMCHAFKNKSPNTRSNLLVAVSMFSPILQNIIDKHSNFVRNLMIVDLVNNLLKDDDRIRPFSRKPCYSNKAKIHEKCREIVRTLIQRNLIVARKIVDGRNDGVSSKVFCKLVDWRGNAWIANGDTVERSYVINKLPFVASYLLSDKKEAASIGFSGKFENPVVQFFLDVVFGRCKFGCCQARPLLRLGYRVIYIYFSSHVVYSPSSPSS